MTPRGFGVLQIHPPHGCDKVQELLRDGIAPLFRHECSFGHAHTAAVFAEKVRVVGERVNREKAQAFGQCGDVLRKRAWRVGRGQVQEHARGGVKEYE